MTNKCKCPVCEGQRNYEHGVFIAVILFLITAASALSWVAEGL